MLARYSRSHGHRLNEIAGEIVGLCDHALLDDDPASAGRALDRVRLLAASLGRQGRELLMVGDPSTEGGAGPVDLAALASSVGRVIGALLPDGAEAVEVSVPPGPPSVHASVGGVTRLFVARVLAGPDAQRVRLEADWTMDQGFLRLVLEGVDEQDSLEISLARVAPEQPVADAVAGAETGERWARVLVAEDNDGLRELMVMALEPLFEEVIPVRDGEEALARLIALDGQVDVALLDLRMPRRGGLDVMGEAMRRWPDIRVVVASGAAPDGVVRAALDAGAVAVLAKPFRLSQLRAVVRGVLANAQW